MDTVESTTPNRLRVMMVTEGTYPFHWGGVSTWCHLLLNDLPNVDFTLISLTGDPAAKPQFNLPASVVEFRAIPIWGVRENLETQTDLRATNLWWRKRRAADHIVAHKFVPVFQALLEELYADAGNPHRLAQLVHSLHRFFLRHDFDTTMRSKAVWKCFVEEAQYGFPRAASRCGYTNERFTLADLTTCFHWLYHWLFPLASPLPKVDVAHAAMAGICTLVAVATKLEHGAAYMLTEHGIYLRERYLAEAATSVSLFRKLFSLNFARRMTELSYAMADLIAPCCDFNKRWELRNGAKLEQLKTIYYGVDPVVFLPEAKSAGGPPVVVWVGRIDPLKDLFTLLRSAAVVRAARPDIEFRLFGSVPPGNESYYEKCLELRRTLGLEETVNFAGFRANPTSAFNEGDIVVLSSVSEAFPFAVLEAMLCEKPVVATAVGGVPEQIEECGIVVEPRNPEAMAEAILKLVNDPETSRSLGTAARQKAVETYGVRQSAQAHETAYWALASRKPGIVPVHVPTGRRFGRPSFPFMRARDTSRDNRQIPASGPGPALVRSARIIPTGFTLPASPAAGLVYVQHLPAVRSGGADTCITGAGENASSSPKQWRVVHTEAILALAAEVAQRDAQPVDWFEVTAVLETLGVTDDVATQRYGAPDVFALGAAVFATIEEGGLAPRSTDTSPTSGGSHKEILIDVLKGPLGLLPPILLLLTIAAFSYWSDWTPQQVLLLSAGMTASLMLTNGLIQGISRRTSLYLGLSRPRMASRYLLASTATVTSIIGGLILLSALTLGQLGLFAGGDLQFFLLSFAALTVVWMAAGGLALVQQHVWLSIAVAAGLLSGIVLNGLLAPYTQVHLAVGAAIGYVATLALIVFALRRGFSRLEALPTSSKAVTKLPPVAYLVDEAAPYFFYGFAYMVLILLPHLFGWFGQVPEGQSRSAAVTYIEVGLTLSMPPLILAYGVAESALRRFWRRVATIQSTTPATSVGRFGTEIVTFVARRRWVYMAALTALTLAAHFAFHAALVQGWLDRWLQLADPAQLLFILDMSLVAYWLLGFGLFNCMFAVTLGRPQVAFRSVVWGGLVMVLGGILLSPLNFALSVVAFVLAALVFAAISWRETRQVLRSADYCFASVLS